MNLGQELTMSKRRVYTPYLGNIMLNAYSEFDTRDDALAYWWAAAKCQEPFAAMLYSGMDGFESNLHLKPLGIPLRLRDKVLAYVAELDEVSFDAAAELERQSREWKP